MVNRTKHVLTNNTSTTKCNSVPNQSGVKSEYIIKKKRPRGCHNRNIIEMLTTQEITSKFATPVLNAENTATTEEAIDPAADVVAAIVEIVATDNKEEVLPKTESPTMSQMRKTTMKDTAGMMRVMNAPIRNALEEEAKVVVVVMAAQENLVKMIESPVRTVSSINTKIGQTRKVNTMKMVTVAQIGPEGTAKEVNADVVAEEVVETAVVVEVSARNAESAVLPVKETRAVTPKTATREREVPAAKEASPPKRPYTGRSPISRPQETVNSSNLHNCRSNSPQPLTSRQAFPTVLKPSLKSEFFFKTWTSFLLPNAYNFV